METIHGFAFQPIITDRHGLITNGVDEFVSHIQTNAISDVMIMCHGFRNDESDAHALYTEFLNNFVASCAHPAIAPKYIGRTFAVAGLFWPSMVLPEPHDSDGGAQSAEDDTALLARLAAMKDGLPTSSRALVDAMLADLPHARTDENARLRMSGHLLELAKESPSDDPLEMRAAVESPNATPESLHAALTTGTTPNITQPGTGVGGVQGIPTLPATGGGGSGQSVLGNILGFPAKFVNLTTFLLMFNRCDGIGNKGASAVVRRVKGLPNPPRVHLIGHSLGGRVVTVCAKALTEAPVVHVETMILLEAAYSHFGLSIAGARSGPAHPRGFFRDVIEKSVVQGPILATHSDQDRVVGFAYTAMAAISLNNAKAIGDEHSMFGGVGRNGALDTPEALMQTLQPAGTGYSFTSGKIHNLNGSKGPDGTPLIRSHGDVRNPDVTWACASLLANA